MLWDFGSLPNSPLHLPLLCVTRASASRILEPFALCPCLWPRACGPRGSSRTAPVLFRPTSSPQDVCSGPWCSRSEGCRDGNGRTPVRRRRFGGDQLMHQLFNGQCVSLRCSPLANAQRKHSPNMVPVGTMATPCRGRHIPTPILKGCRTWTSRRAPTREQARANHRTGLSEVTSCYVPIHGWVYFAARPFSLLLWSVRSVRFLMKRVAGPAYYANHLAICVASPCVTRATRPSRQQHRVAALENHNLTIPLRRHSAGNDF